MTMQTVYVCDVCGRQTTDDKEKEGYKSVYVQGMHAPHHWGMDTNSFMVCQKCVPDKTPDLVASITVRNILRKALAP